MSDNMNCNSTQSHGHDLAALARRSVAFLLFGVCAFNTPKRTEVVIKADGNFKIKVAEIHLLSGLSISEACVISIRSSGL